MRSRLPLLVALLLSLGLALYALEPAWYEPERWLIGNWYHPDCLSNHWLLVWVAEQLAQGQSLVHNDRYYWPVGDYPVLAGNGSEGILYLPFHLLLGWPVGVQYYALLVLTLNGMAGYALARAAGAERWSALVAAAAMGSFPYALQEMSSGRFSQVSVCWMLFFLASWLRFLEAPSRGRALGSAALLCVTAIFYWYYAFFAVLAGAVALGVRAVARRALPPIGLLALFSGAFLLLLSPWAWMFASSWELVPGTGELAEFPHREALNQARPVRWPFQIVEGTELAHAMSAVGFGLALLGVGLALWPRRGAEPPPWRGWAGVAMVLVWGLLWGLSLGPLSSYAPYTLLYGLAEPLRRFWWPIRHEALAQGAAAALGALACSALLSRVSREPVRAALALALALGVPLSLRAQGVRQKVEVSDLKIPPPVYPSLAQRKGEGLIEPPLAPELGGAQQQLIYQLYHGKTLLNGTALWVERVRPDAWDEAMAKNSFVSELQRLERGELDTLFRFQAADLESLRSAGFRWISINREMFPLPFKELTESYTTLLTILFGQPVLRGTGVKVWDLGQWKGKSEASFPKFTWPSHIVKAGPSQRIAGRRPVSLMFGKGRYGMSLPGEF